jgi:predicted P-loop ATPase
MNYLNENYDFRYNTSANEVEFKKKDDKLFIYFDEFEYNSLNVEMDLKGIHIPDQKYKNIIISRFISDKYDPFKDYLLNLPRWDERTDHIAHFLQQVSLLNEARDRKYFIDGFKKWFVALVMSLIEDRPDPYYINQVAFILVGKQHGKHKTTWLGSIVPEKMRLRYYYLSSFNPHNKDHEKYLATKLLINLDEMGSFIKSDIETMKSKITQPQVSLRLPYGRADIYAKRRASFCGSINDRQFLRDETGSRRWFVIEIKDISYDQNFNVDLMYAQALNLYQTKFRYWWDGEDINELELRNEEYTQPSMEEEYLLRAFEPPADKDDSSLIQYLTTSEIATRIAGSNDRMNINNSVIRGLGKALTKHSFQRKSIWQANVKKPVYAWKVKPLINPPNRGEQSLNNGKFENDIF